MGRAERVARRLALLLEKWSGPRSENGDAAGHEDLESASAEDMFGLISEEFGKG
jgi:hypothetical protein